MDAIDTILTSGDVQLSVLVALFLFVTLRLGTMAINAWQQATDRANQREIERNAIEKRQTDVLDSVQRTLQATQAQSLQVTDQLRTVATIINTAGETMTKSRAAADAKLDAMRADIQTVPGEVWRLGDPKLEDITKAVSDMLKDHEKRLVARIDPQAENMRSIIERKFENLQTEVVAQLMQALEPIGEMNRMVTELYARREGTPRKIDTSELAQIADKVIERQQEAQTGSEGAEGEPTHGQ